MPKSTSVTTAIDYGLDSLSGLSSGNKWSFHLLICLVNVMLSIPNIVLYFVLDANMHIIFWMGTAPAYVNLLVPVVLFCVSLSLPVLNCIRLQASSLKVVLFASYFIATVVLMGGGVYVLQVAYRVSSDLIYTCGSSAISERIQSEWKNLSKFHEDCIKHEGAKDIFIQQCPGFGKLRDEHIIYVDYIEAMEFDYNCRGFCEHWSTPLFNPDSDSGQRCASAIGEEVYRVGYLVGLPTITTGIITFIVGAVLQNYKHV